MADKQQLVQETLQRLEDADRQIRQGVLGDFFDKAFGSAGQIPSPVAAQPDSAPVANLTQADVDMAVSQATAELKAEYEKQIEALELDEESELKDRFFKAIERAKAGQGVAIGQPIDKSGTQSSGSAEGGNTSNPQAGGTESGSGAASAGAHDPELQSGSEGGGSSSGGDGSSLSGAASNAQRAPADPVKS